MDIFSSILMNHNVMLADLIAEVLINESPETIGILIQNIKNIVTDFYQETIESLLNSMTSRLTYRLQPPFFPSIGSF